MAKSKALRSLLAALGRSKEGDSWKGFSCTASPRTNSFRCEAARAGEIPRNKNEEEEKVDEEVFRSFNSLYIVSDLNTRASATHSLHPLPEEEEEGMDPASFGGFEFAGSPPRSSIGSVIICDEKGRIFDCPQSEEQRSSSKRSKFMWKDKFCVLDDEEEDSTSTSMEPDLFTCSGSIYSSDVSSSESDGGSEFLAGLFKGLSSERFFFTPESSNSIMEEAKFLRSKAGNGSSSFVTKFAVSSSRYCEIKEEIEDEEGDVIDMVSECSKPEEDEEEDEDGADQTAIMEGSKALRMYSRNPYLDFRDSMEEMVATHNINDWCALQGLLFCYLNLNSEKTHKFILGAFSDLLMELIAASSDNFPVIGFPSAGGNGDG